MHSNTSMRPKVVNITNESLAQHYSICEIEDTELATKNAKASSMPKHITTNDNRSSGSNF